MSTTVAKEARNTAVDGYLWIPIETIPFCRTASLAWFTQLPGNKTPSLLFGASVQLGEKEIAQIHERGYKKLLIRKADLGKLSAALESALHHIKSDHSLSLGIRFSLLQLALWHDLDHCGHKLYSDRFIAAAENAGQMVAELLCEGALLANQLFANSLHFDSVPVHLTNVAGYCVLLAHEMGITDESELSKIAVGAMLHDFGKLFLTQELLEKTTRLSVQERELLERYPLLGYEQLSGRDELEFGQLMMVYQHQERFDGSGYPVAIENEEIHLWARILTIADVFDSMTSARPYRRGNSVADALLYLADNASKQFDPKAVLCWITIFQQP